MNDEYTEEEKEKNGNYVYGGKRLDAICSKLKKSGYTQTEIDLVSVGMWKGIESEKNKFQKEIERLKEENEKLRKCVDFTYKYCLCERSTYGFDYHETHPMVKKGEFAGRLKTPRTFIEDVIGFEWRYKDKEKPGASRKVLTHNLEKDTWYK